MFWMWLPARGATPFICLRETVGRGRMERHHRVRESVKLIFVSPLRREFQKAPECGKSDAANNYRRS